MVTVVGTMERRLGGGHARAMVLEAGGLRVVIQADGEPGHLYEAHGRLWEDRHGRCLRGEDEADACRNMGVTIEEVWTVPNRLTSKDGVTYSEVGPGPGTAVTRADRWNLKDLTVRLNVRWGDRHRYNRPN